MQRSFTFLGAQIAFNCILKEAQKDGGAPVAIAIVGDHDNLLIFGAMDGVLPISTKLAQNKAHSAIAFQRDTLNWKDKNSNFILNTTDPNFTTFPGGIIIKYQGIVSSVLLA